MKSDDLEVWLAAGFDVPTAIAASQPESQSSEEPSIARGAWLVGMVVGLAAVLAASLFLGR